MDKETKDILETVNFIKDHMANKEELAVTNQNLVDLKDEMLDQFEHVEAQFNAAQDRLRDIVSEVTLIHRRIERLEEQGARNAGFAPIMRWSASLPSKGTLVSTRNSRSNHNE